MKWTPTAPKDDLAARNDELSQIVKKGRMCLMVSALSAAKTMLWKLMPRASAIASSLRLRA